MRVLHGLILGGAAIVAAVMVVKSLPSLGSLTSGAAQAVADLGVRLWDGPASAAADYQESVTQATTQPGAFFPTYSVSPYDLIPPGYTMNQYGDLVKTQQNYGVTGTW